MIIARAPVRLSFAGGGTDLPAYADTFGGLVVSTAISRYVYVILREGTTGAPVHLISSDAGNYMQGRLTTNSDIAGAAHLPWAILDYFGITRGIELFIASQVPSGTGLGSSSALAVALIHALSCYAGRPMSPVAVAELACDVEINRLGSPIGRQDQYASALGGLNEISFAADHVAYRPLLLSPATRDQLETRLMLFYTGARRDAGTILSHQRRDSEERNPRTIESLHALKQLARQVIETLESGDLAQFGDLMHEAWMRKRQVTDGISNAFIDHCYTVARQAGARGGKITGAGGGGFLLFDCPPDCRDAVTNALVPLGLQAFVFNLEDAPAGLVG